MCNCNPFLNFNAAFWVASILLIFSFVVHGKPVGHFFASTLDRDPVVLQDTLPDTLSWLADDKVSHFRLIPGTFPDDMKYHFDGLASVMKFQFEKDGSITYQVKSYESVANQKYDQCDFFGSGTGPTNVLKKPCLTNPVVNLLPIDNQLWLTIDTRFWGRVDPETLETVSAFVQVDSTTLNAHPACEPFSSDCYVQHPCGINVSIDEVCLSKLITTTERLSDITGLDFDILPEIMKTETFASAKLSDKVKLQHSHSPALTETLIISKVESFQLRKEHDPDAGGVLKRMHQREDNQFFIHNKKTNSSYISTSDFTFVNNHFWNAFDTIDESNTESITILDTIPATSQYLDNYFYDNLDKEMVDWESILKSPMRCIVPHSENDNKIKCSKLLEDDRIIDYPTYNPLMKTKEYNYFYAISPLDKSTSRWFDTIVKYDVHTGKLLASWNQPGIYVTEVDFIPKEKISSSSDTITKDQEDDGVLISILYNEEKDSSSLGLFNAKNLQLLKSIPLLGDKIAFHAHGIVCTKGKCYSNP